MKTTVSPRPLTDNREVAALLHCMIQHQQKQYHADFTALLQTVSMLEDQLRVTNAELRNVKRELNTARDSLTTTQRSTGERLVKTAETALRQTGEQLRSIREKIVQTAKKNAGKRPTSRNFRPERPYQFARRPQDPARYQDTDEPVGGNA